MKQDSMTGILLVFGIAITGALIFGLWLVGADTLRTVFMILAVCIGLALLTVAGAFFVRALRHNSNPPMIEKHFYHDGTKTIERHTIDGRAEKPVLYQLPAQQGGPAFPDVLRAAYTAGLLTNGKQSEPPIDGEARELGPDEWGGDIRP